MFHDQLPLIGSSQAQHAAHVVPSPLAHSEVSSARKTMEGLTLVTVSLSMNVYPMVDEHLPL